MRKRSIYRTGQGHLVEVVREGDDATGLMYRETWRARCECGEETFATFRPASDACGIVDYMSMVGRLVFRPIRLTCGGSWEGIGTVETEGEPGWSFGIRPYDAATVAAGRAGE